MKKQLISLALIIVCFTNSQAQDKLHLTFYDFNVLKDAETQKLKILHKGKTRYDDLKFVAIAERSLQILTAKNEVFYLNNKLDSLPFPEKHEELYCGTVDDFEVEIVEKDTYYLINKTINPIDGRLETTTQTIDSINKKTIKNICFLNSERIIQYDENFYFPETLVIQTKDNKMGLKSAKEIEFYDEINYSNPYFIKVKNNNLWGYYHITKLRYRVLKEYNYNLARFELENGQKGFIDLKGNEYL